MSRFIFALDLLTLVIAVEVIDCDGSNYYVHYKSLPSVPTDIPPNSTSVNLAFNSITNLTSGVFSQLPICRHLIVAYNSLAVIEPGAFNGLLALRQLDLSYNSIFRLEEDIFSALTNLEELRLPYNRFIRSIPNGTFNGLHRLKTLRLNSNSLTQIESTMWTGLQLLETVDIMNNFITTIFPEAFSSLTLLKTLNLAQNYLTELHGNMWMGLQSLEVLNISENSITKIPRHGLFHLSALRILHLYDNEIRSLRADIFNPDDYPDSNGRPPRLELILARNPLQCNSALCWLEHGLQSGTIYIRKPVRCSNLGEYFGYAYLDCTSVTTTTESPSPTSSTKATDPPMTTTITTAVTTPRRTAPTLEPDDLDISTTSTGGFTEGTIGNDSPTTVSPIDGSNSEEKSTITGKAITTDPIEPQTLTPSGPGDPVVSNVMTTMATAPPSTTPTLTTRSEGPDVKKHDDNGSTTPPGDSSGSRTNHNLITIAPGGDHEEGTSALNQEDGVNTMYIGSGITAAIVVVLILVGITLFVGYKSKGLVFNKQGVRTSPKPAYGQGSSPLRPATMRQPYNPYTVCGLTPLHDYSTPVYSRSLYRLPTNTKPRPPSLYPRYTNIKPVHKTYRSVRSAYTAPRYAEINLWNDLSYSY